MSRGGKAPQYICKPHGIRNMPPGARRQPQAGIAGSDRCWNEMGWTLFRSLA